MIGATDYLPAPSAPYTGKMGAAGDESIETPPGAGCDDALADDLGWGLGVVFRAYVTAAHAAVAELPGGPRGYQVLAAATRSDVGSQLALAQHLGIDRTVMTYLLDDLEAAGLIERRPDPADRRARRVVATERGATLLTQLDQRLRTAETLVLEPLDAGERDTFRRQLRQLATRINALDPVDTPCDLVDHAEAELPTARTPLARATRRQG
jgi:DNA-binding MarR family transcriptional regulator